MRKIVSRYGKQVMVFICTLVIMAGSICSFSFESKASDVLYYEMPTSEPTTSINSGYIVILWESKTNGVRFPYLYQWNVTPYKDSVTSATSVDIDIYKNGSLELAPSLLDTQLATFTVICTTNGGITTVVKSELWTDDLDYYSISYSSGYKIAGYYVKGNYGVVSSDFSYGEDVNFVCSWADDELQLQYMINMYNQLVQANANDSTMISKLTDIFNSVDSVETKIDEMKALQEETNSWLEKIYNKICEALGLDTEESLESLPDEDISSTLEAEDSLMQDTTDAEASMDFSIDSNSNSVVWNIIERVLNANPKVFGAFIGIMTLGVVTLLLNR